MPSLIQYSNSQVATIETILLYVCLIAIQVAAFFEYYTAKKSFYISLDYAIFLKHEKIYVDKKMCYAHEKKVVVYRVNCTFQLQSSTLITRLLIDFLFHRE